MINRILPFSIAEQDSSPTVWHPWQIQFPNGTVIDNNNGTVFVNTGVAGEVVEARSPLLKSGTIMSVLTDGTTSNFLRGDGIYAIPASNSGVKLAVFTVYSSTTWTAENIPIFQVPFETPITITQLNATVSGGASPQLGFNIDHRIWGSLGVTGTNLFANVQSANSTGFQAVSFTSANIPARAHLILVSSAVIAGNVDYITGSVYYTRDSI